MERIVVEPLAGGWAVNSFAADNPMIFARGPAAERAGRDLARRVAAAGTPVQFQLRLRDGSTAAKYVCLPPAGRGPDPEMVWVKPTPDRRPPAGAALKPGAANA